MITMTKDGITVTVNKSDLDFYKRAGYAIVTAAEPIKAVEPAKVEPAKDADKKPAKGDK